MVKGAYAYSRDGEMMCETCETGTGCGKTQRGRSESGPYKLT
jgi:hypothetical protein